eukprot:TRINITY_DN72443_c0_g1_i1.p1 TRINITY_DN72443_c0_g1~~TRINITY_DN72443_c0_g1_i1.p1  ORF type:complete len:701 (+),score=199.73 TRINITY_DN72443_c0_g1_i1:116-2218(+)
MADNGRRDDLDLSLASTKQLAAAVEQFASQREEFDRRLQQEAGEHAQTKAVMRSAEEALNSLKMGSETERKDAMSTKQELEELERFNAKSQDALKAIADDLVSVRLENEALRAEMETQRKAFVVAVNWAARHAEQKTKLDDAQAEYDRMQAALLEMKEEIDAAQRTQEEYEAARGRNEQEAKAIIEENGNKEAQGGMTDEMKEMLAEMEILKEKLQQEKEAMAKQKESTREKMKSFLRGGDNTLLQQIITEWQNFTKTQKFQKAKKDQNFKVAMRGIANSQSGTLDFCLTAWNKCLQEAKMAKVQEAKRALEDKQGGAGSNAMRGRQKALAQLEKHLGNEAKGLTREVFALWGSVRGDRLRKDRAKAMAYRSVAGNDQALLVQIVQGWTTVLAEARLKRERKAVGQARAMRLIANGDNALQDFCLTQWAAISKTAAATKKAKEGANVKAARLINNSANGMKQQIYVSWFQLVSKAKDKAKKMKAVERNLASTDGQVVAMVFSTWKAWQEAEHKTKAKKIMNMNAANKAIRGSQETLLKQVVVMWKRVTADEKTGRLNENLKNVKGTVDEAAYLESQEQVEKLRPQVEDYKAKIAEMAKLLLQAEAVLSEREGVLKGLEHNFGLTKRELEESKRKARDINDELSKVGSFLSTWPRRKSREDSNGGKVNSAALPKIGNSGNGTSRPRSGQRTSAPGARQAWE